MTDIIPFTEQKRTLRLSDVTRLVDHILSERHSQAQGPSHLDPNRILSSSTFHVKRSITTVPLLCDPASLPPFLPS